jgi:peptidyl-prolyl cis-trans isomerase C
VVGVVLLAPLVVGSGTAVALDRIEAVPAGAAFRIGDTVLTEAQLGARVKLLGALYGVRPPTDPAQLDRFRRDSAKAVAVSDVLDDAARAKGIVIADKTANDQLTHVVETSSPEGRDAFVAKLAAVGVSQQELLDEVKRQLADAQLFDQVTRDVPGPTDLDVAQAYQQRRAEMAVPEKRHLRNIVLDSPDRANQVRAQLASGTDFAVLAGQASLDDSTKAKGGDLGTVTRAELEQPYGDAAFAVGPNTVFGPVQTRHGWNVGQVLEVTPAVPLLLDQVHDQLRDSMRGQRREDAWNGWLGAELRSSHVRYADAYRPADPDEAVPTVERATPRDR